MGFFHRTKDDPASESEDEEVLLIVDQAVDPHVVMFHDPHGAEAEQFRGLRNQIVAMNHEHSPRSIVITSALAHEGKSITTLNLAIALTELHDSRVVALDADLRNPNLENLLGMSRRRGLADVLMGRISLDRALQKTAFRQLSLIGAGSQSRNPAELVAAERTVVLVNALKENFNYILIDAPPALDLTDATVLGRVADGVIVVVRLEVTPRQEVERALAILENVGANVLGTFLVGTRKVKRKGAYHYDYSYSGSEEDPGSV